MDLEALRGEIDEIDSELVRLFCRRMDTVRAVAQYKSEHGLPVFHPERERKVIEKVSARAGKEYGTGAGVLFQTIMDISKSYQHIQLSGERGARLRAQIGAALGSGATLPKKARVACQGVPGAYSHEAARQMFPSPDLSFCGQFEDVFEAVRSGECDYGVLPIENSSNGSVTRVYDLLRDYRLTICRSYKLPVNHCLLTSGETDLQKLTDIYSHEQGLGQCSQFLRQNPQLRVHIYRNTAAAAKFVADCGSATAAAIASEECARLYGLTVAARDFQNARQNFTRFICMSRELIIEPGANKISLSLTLPHTAGSLYRLISRFAAQSLNLTKLESRPLPDTDFEFLFYFDFEGSVREKPVLDLLCSLQEELGHFEFLGNYKG
ncbi:bifunctional chorismate mutase/prephenate dehydratase [Harryflintia acetispora]|uniref:bifunctional chorismate mutase/prephenate dehydratase n=1 Tax=Harryflintia acetispora TaxID=1849041 RepID=UPI00104C9E67|nr:bifunctional chorismate mutase/prephenate dehydratase [Harryflintia acetispora]